MAALAYNGVLLENVATTTYSVEPVYDPSRVDLECVKVTIEVEGVWTDYGLGSTKGGGYALNTGVEPAPRPWTAWGVKGDRLGISLFNLREKLLTPRQRLHYWVGRDLVVLSPQPRGDGEQYPCDVKGGPIPSHKTMVKITGDRTAWVRFRVETWISSCARYLLSNRWETRESCDEHGFTTIVYSGRASFRKDFLVDESLEPGDFVKWLILPAEVQMKRKSVDVVHNREGTEVSYTVVDKMTNYGTGKNSQISKIDCNVSHVAEGAIKSFKQLGQEASKFAQNFASVWTGSPIAGNMAMAGQIWNWTVPHNVLAGICQVWGHVGADRLYLARVAHSMIQDRLCKGFNVSRRQGPTTMAVHVDWSDENPPYVEVTAEYMGPPIMTDGMLSRDQVLNPLNWDPVIQGAPLALDFRANRDRTQLPGGENTRGAYIGRLVSQGLSMTLCGGPAQPPAPGEGERELKAQNTESPYGLST